MALLPLITNVVSFVMKSDEESPVSASIDSIDTYAAELRIVIIPSAPSGLATVPSTGPVISATVSGASVTWSRLIANRN